MSQGYKVGGVMLPDGPFMIGAGVSKTPDATREWLKVAPVVSGSYTPEPREGNSGRVFYPDTIEEVRRLGYGLNSYGMPNRGFEAAAKELAAIDAEQPLIVSVAGFSVKDYLQGAEILGGIKTVSAIELNFGCPNTEHKIIASFDPVTVEKVLDGLTKLADYRKPVWVKLSPYSNPAELQYMAELVSMFAKELVLAVVTCNTFPFAYAGKGKIDPSHGRAGLSGPALKHIALGQVHQFREHLEESIDIIGVGGIMNGSDIVEFLDAGATAVQMTSWPFWTGDPRRFKRELLAADSAASLIEYLTRNS